jgi:glycosyltransferase involved in cell wall biosynthesis
MKLSPGVTAVIPTIQPRFGPGMLNRALRSVMTQSRPVDAVSIAADIQHKGAAATRNRALAGVTTRWSAFLDDDDEWLPAHVAALLDVAEQTGADMVYPWFEVPEGWDPFPQYEGQPFQPEWLDKQNMIPVTVLARTDLIQDVGGFRPQGPPDNPCDDWGAWLALRGAGAKIVHLNRRTWLWHWHGSNTSGRGDRW